MRATTTIALLTLATVLASLPLRADEGAPAAAAPAAEIARLVKELGADDFRTREEASQRLAELGAPARPALEAALRESKSPEVRWRAEQILLRMDGEKARPLGVEDERPAAGGPGAEDPQDPIARIRRLMEEWTKRFEGPLHRDPFQMPFGPFSAARRVQVPGLVLERSGPSAMRLTVQRANEAGAPVEDVYEGTSLQDILHRNPALADHPGMDDLKRREAENAWPGFDEWFGRQLPHVRTEPGSGGTSFSFSTSQGVSVQQDADGVTVRITERGEDGKEDVREFKGESLEELTAKYPHLKEKLGGLRIHVRAPDFFWPGREPGRSPLRPLLPAPVTPPAADAPFGLSLGTPDEVLAVHLGIEPGSGALVTDVRPDSQAAQLGLAVRDVLVRIDGQRVDVDGAVQRLRAAAGSRGPLQVELIRRGKMVTLSR